MSSIPLIHKQWNELFEQAQKLYTVFEDLDNLSRTWQPWYEELLNMNMPDYQTINSNCLEIWDHCFKEKLKKGGQ